MIRSTLLILTLLIATPLLLCGCPSEEQTITMRAINGAPYTPGGTVDIEVRFDYYGNKDILAVGVNQVFPLGWTLGPFPTQSGNNALPALFSDTDGLMEFIYITPPALPATFVYSVNVPANASGPIEIQGYTKFGFYEGFVLSPVITLTLQQAS